MRLSRAISYAASFLGAVVLLASVATDRSFGQSPPLVDKDPFKHEFKFDNDFLFLFDEESEQPGADGDKLRAELKALEATLEEKLRDTQKIKAQIEQMRGKMKSADQLKESKTESKSATGTLRLMLDAGDGKQTPHEIILRNVNGVWTIANANERGGEKVVGKIVTTTGTPAVTEKKGVVVTVDPKIEAQYKVIPDNKGGPGSPPASADANKRIDSLEKKLDKLMDVLEQMRKELDGSGKKSGAEADKNADQLRVAEAAKRAAEKETVLKRAEERAIEQKRAADERAIEQKRAAEERAIAAEQRAIEQKRQAEQRQVEVQRLEALRERERAIQAELKSLEVLRQSIQDGLKKENPDSKKSGAKEPKEPKPEKPE